MSALPWTPTSLNDIADRITTDHLVPLSPFPLAVSPKPQEFEDDTQDLPSAACSEFMIGLTGEEAVMLRAVEPHGSLMHGTDSGSGAVIPREPRANSEIDSEKRA